MTGTSMKEKACGGICKKKTAQEMRKEGFENEAKTGITMTAKVPVVVWKLLTPGKHFFAQTSLDWKM